MAIFQVTWVSRYQNVCSLDLLELRTMEVVVTCKSPVKSLPPTNKHKVFLQAGCPSCSPTNHDHSSMKTHHLLYLYVHYSAAYETQNREVSADRISKC